MEAHPRYKRQVSQFSYLRKRLDPLKVSLMLIGKEEPPSGHFEMWHDSLCLYSIDLFEAPAIVLFIHLHKKIHM